MSQRTPREILRRVLRLSFLNGWSVALTAGFCGLLSLAFGGVMGGGIGLLVAAGGVGEILGRRRLTRHDPDGVDWLVKSQLFVLGVVWAYAISRLMSFDSELAASNLTPDMKALLDQAGFDLNLLLPWVRLVFHAIYATVILVTLIYQGGLALYYHRRRAAIREALTALPPILPAGLPDDRPPSGTGHAN
jgi:hypothetical protein